MKLFKLSIGYKDLYFKSKEDLYKFFDAVVEFTPLECEKERVEKVTLPDEDGWRDSDQFAVGLKSMDVRIEIEEIEFASPSKIVELKKEREKANKELLKKKKELLEKKKA